VRSKERRQRRNSLILVLLPIGNDFSSSPLPRGTASTKAAADQFAANMLPVIREIQKEGVTSAAGIAAALNKRGITTARGKEWRNVQVAAAT
jgi:hypothetical protein